MKRDWLVAVLLGVLGLGTGMPLAGAYGDLKDPYILDLKGFSPETIHATEAQINRMEGRYPEKPPTRGQQAKYNFLNNEWAGDLQPFTYNNVNPPKEPWRWRYSWLRWPE